MSKSLPPNYAELCKLMYDAATLNAVGSLLNWDQETYMPPAGAGNRADQNAMIAEMVHAKRTSARVGELIASCEQDAEVMGDAVRAANVREMRRDFGMATRLPGDLVAELAKVGSQSQEAWKEARAKSDFAMFRPWLEKMMNLTRRKAECYGTPSGGELYDALLDEYEPGMRCAQVDAIFGPLRERLSGLIADVSRSKRKISTRCLTGKVDARVQNEFGHVVLRAIGFDLNAGRLDVTTHPFCSGFGPGDTRLTTRYRDERFTDALYGTMHEAGHGMYEQGLPKEKFFGQPIADAISLGIHESQSRMWENFVGRSREFWVWALPKAKKAFGKALSGVDVKAMYAAVNTARPSFIRVEADESTYNLHIMLRYGLEREMVSGDLKIKDLPGEWNERFEKSLGLRVPDDRRGCLQDVHWSFGLVGYFATYTLGNLYAAQFWEKINKDIKDLPARISKGDFAPLLAWLRKKIHQHGKRYRAGELCELVTGRPLSSEPLLRHLEGKVRPIYGV